MIDALKKELASRKIHGWRINERHTQKIQRYLIGDQRETDLYADKQDYSLTVYVKVGAKIGEGSVSITSSEEIPQKIADVIVAAKHSLSPSYALPQKGSIKKIKTADPYLLRSFSVGTQKKDLDVLENRLRKTLKKEKNVRLASAELSLAIATSRIVSSTGIDVTQDKTRVFCDLAVIGKCKNVERDFTPQMSSARYDDCDVETFITRACSCARDAAQSQQAQSFEGNVLISDEALQDIFVPPVAPANPWVMHCLARRIYGGYLKHKKGDVLCSKNLTLISDPTLPYGVASSSFDSEGVSSSKVTLIKNGKIDGFLAATKYAQYLKVPVATPLANMVVGAGKKRAEELKEDEHIEIVKFSSFIPDSFTGAFSAEVRLGYRYEDGKRIPFKGGLLVGNLFKTDLEFSEEVISQGGYEGPSVMRIKAKLSAH